jgi:hypothetical protein
MLGRPFSLQHQVEAAQVKVVNPPIRMDCEQL